MVEKLGLSSIRIREVILACLPKKRALLSRLVYQFEKETEIGFSNSART